MSWFARDLGLDLISTQGINKEMATFPALYAPPHGALRLAMIREEPIGAVGLKRLEPGICEMKRLFVAPGHRGTGAGRLLAEAIIDDARTLGYRAMRLDTLEQLTAAQALYTQLGFSEIPRYNDNPFPQVQFYELTL